MPLYEYECPACERRFEIMRSHQDPAVKTCPNCKSRRITKLISAPAFQLKGSGWYKTDYADSKGKKSRGGEATGGAAESASEGSSESSASLVEASKDSASKSPSETSSSSDKNSSGGEKKKDSAAGGAKEAGAKAKR